MISLALRATLRVPPLLRVGTNWASFVGKGFQLGVIHGTQLPIKSKLPDVEIPKHLSLPEIVLERAKEYGDKTAMVALASLESLLLSHPAIADVCVTAVPDQMAGELPRAYVVLKPDIAVTEQELMAFVEDHVARYMKLRGGVEFTDAIPKSAARKILRKVIKTQFEKEEETDWHYESLYPLKGEPVNMVYSQADI